MNLHIFSTSDLRNLSLISSFNKMHDLTNKFQIQKTVKKKKRVALACASTSPSWGLLNLSIGHRPAALSHYFLRKITCSHKIDSRMLKNRQKTVRFYIVKLSKLQRIRKKRKIYESSPKSSSDDHQDGRDYGVAGSVHRQMSAFCYL